MRILRVQIMNSIARSRLFNTIIHEVVRCHSCHRRSHVDFVIYAMRLLLSMAMSMSILRLECLSLMVQMGGCLWPDSAMLLTEAS
jgi:hypothetical protein